MACFPAVISAQRSLNFVFVLTDFSLNLSLNSFNLSNITLPKSICPLMNHTVKCWRRPRFNTEGELWNHCVNSIVLSKKRASKRLSVQSQRPCKTRKDSPFTRLWCTILFLSTGSQTGRRCTLLRSKGPRAEPAHLLPALKKVACALNFWRVPVTPEEGNIASLHQLRSQFMPGIVSNLVHKDKTIHEEQAVSACRV